MEHDRRTTDRRISPAIGEFAITENARLRASNAELVDALDNLRTQLHEHIRMNVKKHYSLMVADAPAGTVCSRYRNYAAFAKVQS